jgi:hypothetical protein
MRQPRATAPTPNREESGSFLKKRTKKLFPALRANPAKPGFK